MRAYDVSQPMLDLAISGWSICYLVDWNRSGWVNQFLAGQGFLSTWLAHRLPLPI